MSEFVDGNVQANGINLHYYRAGQPGKPTVVLLHGITDDGMCWVRVAHALNNDFDLVLLDARGHGKSDAPEKGYASEDHPADAAGVIDALCLDRPVLFGHSMGANTALTTAALYPAKVRAIILEDPPLRTQEDAEESDRVRRSPQWLNEIIELRTASKEALVARARSQNPQWPEEELGPWAEAKQRVSPNIARAYSPPQWHWKERLAKVRCPVLLITGDPARNAIITPQIVGEVTAILPSAQVVRVPNAGHSIHRDQFEMTMQAVRSFLAGIA